MERAIFQVEGMSCSHCEAIIRKSLEALGGVRSVEVDLGGKTVTVDYDASRVSADALSQQIEDQGYEVSA